MTDQPDEGKDKHETARLKPFGPRFSAAEIEALRERMGNQEILPITVPPPRRIALLGGMETVFFGGLAAIAVCAVTLAVTLGGSVYDLARLHLQGVVMEVTLAEKTAQPDQARTLYSFAYSIPLTIDSEFPVRERVPREEYDKRTVGEQFPVTFLKADPSVHVRGRVNIDHWFDALITAWVYGPLALIVVVAIVWKMPFELFWLGRWGFPAVGTLTQVYEDADETAHHFFFAFEFRDALNRRFYGHAKVGDKGLRDHFRVGDRCVVLYNPANPVDNCAYMFSGLKILGTAWTIFGK